MMLLEQVCKLPDLAMLPSTSWGMGTGSQLLPTGTYERQGVHLLACWRWRSLAQWTLHSVQPGDHHDG
jgi:hypothetical protein